MLQIGDCAVFRPNKGFEDGYFKIQNVIPYTFKNGKVVYFFQVEGKTVNAEPQIVCYSDFVRRISNAEYERNKQH